MKAIRFELDPKTIGLLVLAVAAIWLLIQLWVVLLLVVIALVLVGTLKPIVEWLERRRLGRGPALAVIFVGMLAVLAGLVLLTVPPLVSQLVAVLDDAPATKAKIVTWLQDHQATRSLASTLRESNSDAWFERASGQILAYSTRLITILGYGFTTIVLAFYILADGKRTQGAVYALVPRAYHLRLSRIILNLETIVGGYVRGQLITSAAIMVFTFGLLTVLRVPNALSLAVFAGFADVIPFVGGLLATVPAVLVGLSRGVGTASIIAIVLFVYQEFESRVLVPRIYGHVLRLSSTAVLLALIIGGTLMGIIGALLALPIAAGLQMIAREMRVSMPGDDSSAPELVARDLAAEKTYEERSAGAPPAEAGVIASELAKEIRAEDVATQGDASSAADLPVTGGHAP
jgi:predicted PurR-regulated permease PerM